LGRGCGPCTRIEKTRKSAQRIFSRLRDGSGDPRTAGLSPAPSIKAALRCRARPFPRARGGLLELFLCHPERSEGTRILPLPLLYGRGDRPPGGR